MKTSITLYDALRSIDVPADKAKDVIEAMESDMNELATKQDLNQGLKNLEDRLTSQMFRMLMMQTFAIAGLVVAIVKLL
ncbi:hypothetical protein [Nitrincola nitratireducens]|uniref:DUF1640 domain-containing protein n=1 Tax=Nitrincola nitratireducens TaxID=1229521 RepID=W9URF4_9GAMM|nr:hypothetical protein [Nitrincola nitratireducens]EXJ09674.1 hypothetical protein D791_03346 [Nitrincola nitratireducens]